MFRSSKKILFKHFFILQIFRHIYFFLSYLDLHYFKFLTGENAQMLKTASKLEAKVKNYICVPISSSFDLFSNVQSDCKYYLIFKVSGLSTFLEMFAYFFQAGAAAE